MGDYCNFSFNTFLSTHYTSLSTIATDYFNLPCKILNVVLQDTPRSWIMLVNTFGSVPSFCMFTIPVLPKKKKQSRWARGSHVTHEFFLLV